MSVAYDALNSSINGVIITNQEGKITYCNPAFLRMFKYKNRVEVLGKYSKDLFATEKVQKLSDVSALIDQEKGATEEFPVRRKDGTEFPVEVSSSIVTDEEGNNVGRMASFKDITERKRAEEELKESEKKLRQSFIELAETTSRVLGVSDPYTQKHEQRVAELAREVGRRMGLDEDKLLGLYLGGTLHDIGKIIVPGHILTKPGDLLDVERELIKSHPEVGYDQILADTDFPWPVAEMTLHHHERLDGSGYPDGLEGDELTNEVRILGAVDVVEAMSTRRPYREARSKERTLKVIKDGKGDKFDPEVVDILVEMIEEGEIEFDDK